MCTRVDVSAEQLTRWTLMITPLLDVFRGAQSNSSIERRQDACEDRREQSSSVVLGSKKVAPDVCACSDHTSSHLRLTTAGN